MVKTTSNYVNSFVGPYCCLIESNYQNIDKVKIQSIVKYLHFEATYCIKECGF